jgi:cytoskeletal protein CcmA (bactofilin family)
MMWRRKRDYSSEQALPAGSPSTSHSGDGVSRDQEGAAQLASQEVNLAARNVDQFVGGWIPTFESPALKGVGQRAYKIPRGYKISANIFTARPIAIQGEVEGKELVAGVVTVFPGGVLRGKSRVGTLLAAGLVDGTVEASNMVELASQGEIKGDLKTPAMKAQAGAQLNGASLKIGHV